jgi:hypothetical protein
VKPSLLKDAGWAEVAIEPAGPLWGDPSLNVKRPNWRSVDRHKAGGPSWAGGGGAGGYRWLCVVARPPLATEARFSLAPRHEGRRLARPRQRQRAVAARPDDSRGALCDAEVRPLPCPAQQPARRRAEGVRVAPRVCVVVYLYLSITVLTPPEFTPG